MKKSTKIILTYVLLLLAGALAMYIAEKYVGKKGQEKERFNTFTKKLAPFRVIVAEESAWFRIEMSDSNSIEWKLPKEMSMKGVPAFVRNDTLFVMKRPSLEGQEFVVRSSSLTSIVTSKRCTIRLIDPKLDKLTVLGKGGTLYMDIEQFTTAIRIGLLDIVGTKMESIVINTPVNTLHAQLDSVHLSTSSSINEVNLRMVNNSFVEFNTNPLSRFQMEKDSTSVIRLY